ncbi:MAG: efflux RND transporter permease subunit [Marinilabiliales bacterium]|nr:efflux RND transporter permease subunit [Marinilabiliales bacterium]
MLMTIYLNEAMEEMLAESRKKSLPVTFGDIRHGVIKGAVKQLRPKIMTVSVSLFGLFPVLWASGAGSDVMLPITLPLIGGLFTSTIHVLLVTPLIFEMSGVNWQHGTVKIFNTSQKDHSHPEALPIKDHYLKMARIIGFATADIYSERPHVQGSGQNQQCKATH